MISLTPKRDLRTPGIQPHNPPPMIERISKKGINENVFKCPKFNAPHVTAKVPMWN